MDSNLASNAFVFVSLGDVMDRQGDYEGARARYEQALELINTKGGDIWAAAYALSSYGQAAARHSDEATAQDRYEQALSIYQTIGDQRGEARVTTLLAELANQRGDSTAALELLYDALRIRCGLNDAPGICAALEKFSTAATDADMNRAARILAAASALRERTGARLAMGNQAEVDQVLARLQQGLGPDFVRVWQQGSLATVDDALRDAAAVVGR
jgi:tetratricopeptide (TPR) repeat protein